MDIYKPHSCFCFNSGNCQHEIPLKSTHKQNQLFQVTVKGRDSWNNRTYNNYSVLYL